MELRNNVMNYRLIADTDIKVSEIGFGLWTLSTKKWGSTDKSSSLNVLRTAREYGITLFDTADSYGNGYGEELIKEAFCADRHQIIISTKIGIDLYSQQIPGDSDVIKNFSYDYLIYACEQSLKRMGTDYIDILNLYHPGINDIESDEMFEALDKLQKDGKIRSWGVTLDISAEFEEIIRILFKERNSQILQIPYNPIQTSIINTVKDIVSEDLNLSIFARRIDISSYISDIDNVKDLFLEFNPHLVGVHNLDDLTYQFSQKINNINDICRENNITSQELGKNYALFNNHISTLLPNIRNVEDLRFYVTEEPIRHDYESIFNTF